jgi:shikimate dehydrogenase
MTLTGKARLAGLMGWPVSHSRSPRLHNWWIERYGIDGVYVPLAVRPDDLGAALQALPKLGFAGCNLTIPHKEAALAVMDEVDGVARRVGAVNTVAVLPDGRLWGSNSDAFGFAESLKADAPGWRADSGPAVVLGAGGAARAVIVALQDLGARILVLNRTRARADELAREFACQAADWEDRDRALEGAGLLVNTTSQGMTGEPPLEIALERLPPAAVVCDVVYVPLRTPLLQAAAARGNPTVDGLNMLLHQARPGFERWFGVRPEVTPELRAHVLASL